MKPKEKAEELMDIYSNILPSRNSIVDIPDFDIAKLCALIAVDEIIKSCPLEPANPYDYVIAEREAMEFWQEVKQEIEKL